MLKSPLLFAISVLITLLSWTGAAKAADNSLGLSFELPATEQPLLTNKPAEIPFSLAQTETGKKTEPVAPDKSLDQSLAKLTRPQESLPPIALAIASLELDDWIFEGGSQSLVAHTVGSAEGTRHWDGGRTQAYYGHQDPGNGVWNLGTFSYQHEASSPEEADEKQIKRLKYQGFQLEEQAAQQGIKLSLVEKLNGLDLANQAPLAALGEGGYVERLAQAQRLALKEEEAIAWARTRSYLDPDTRAWNAPGLGNTLNSISQDQERRMLAIDKALRAYNQPDTAGLALADLKNIHLENSESPVEESSSTLENASEVTFVLPPTPHASSIEGDVLASIAPAAIEPTDTESIQFESADPEFLASEPLGADELLGAESMPSESLEPVSDDSAERGEKVAIARLK